MTVLVRLTFVLSLKIKKLHFRHVNTVTSPKKIKPFVRGKHSNDQTVFFAPEKMIKRFVRR